MQNKQATGVDTWMMMPIFGSLFVIISVLFLPWFSIPALKYSRFPITYSAWNIENCVDNIQKSIEAGGKLKMPALGAAEIAGICKVGNSLRTAAVILVVMMVICAVLVYRMRARSRIYVRVCFAFSGLMSVAVFLSVGAGNLLLNEKMERVSDFVNLTAHSYIQLSSWQYAQLFISVAIIACARHLLDTESEPMPQMYMARSLREDRRMGTRTKVTLILILFAIPMAIFFGIFFLDNRSSSFVAVCIIGLAMIPFGMVFEDRKPQARELLLIAVMAAIAVVGRMAFFMIPQFKPVTAIVIITGVGLGAEAGFLTGAIAGFVSNFFFGQGPWTPWQMFAFGIIGFLAGLIFKRHKTEECKGKKAKWMHKLLLCAYGGVATLIIYGFLLDTSSVLMFSQGFSKAAFAAVYLSGLPFNIIHGISTMIFLFFLAAPMEQKLERIKKKYGILNI